MATSSCSPAWSVFVRPSETTHPRGSNFRPSMLRWATSERRMAPAKPTRRMAASLRPARVLGQVSTMALSSAAMAGATRRFFAPWTRLIPRNTFLTAARLHGLSRPSASWATLIEDSQRASVVGLWVVACAHK